MFYGRKCYLVQKKIIINILSLNLDFITNYCLYFLKKKAFMLRRLPHEYILNALTSTTNFCDFFFFNSFINFMCLFDLFKNGIQLCKVSSYKEK